MADTVAPLRAGHAAVRVLGDDSAGGLASLERLALGARPSAARRDEAIALGGRLALVRAELPCGD